MQVDGRRISDNATLEADVCIVGAGPAGLVLARELISASVNVVIIESGGFESDPVVQQLNEGTIVGDPYLGLRQTRHRQVGGTTHTWNTFLGGERGAKYVPLDPWDLDERGQDGLSGWPFTFTHLKPFYHRAQEICGLGPFEYDGAPWSDSDHALFALDGINLTSKVYQLGVGRHFTHTLGREVAGSRNATLYHHATVTGLLAGDGRGRVGGVGAVTSSGAVLRVQARFVVLAGGAIENARLVLLFAESRKGGLAGGTDWVGRCFMEHPRDYALTLFPKSPDFYREASFYDVHATHDGTLVCGRIALTEQAVRAGLPNASMRLLPRVQVRRPPGGLAGRIVQRVHSLGGRLPGGSIPGRALRRVHALFRGPAEPEYGWSQGADPSRPFDAFRVLVHLEQRPHPENRVVLDGARDRHGIRRAALHLRWRDEEQAELVRLRTVLADWLEGAGLGRVEVEANARPDPNAHHHAGTTRMHADPSWGVTNPEGRLHALENLYVTGASLFPTAGFANPMLTIVAMSLRLGDHLKASLVT